MNNLKQLTPFSTLLVIFALCDFATYTFFMDDLDAIAGVPVPE